jgi:putative transposase
MDLVEDLAEPSVSVVAACTALGVSPATLYRATAPSTPPMVRERAPGPRPALARLSDDERQAIVDVMHAPEFVGQPPTEVFAKLLSRGVYLASIRTIYRVLAELGESKERRNQRLPRPHVKPSLTATAPNQVWTWDITKLATLERGIFLHAYVIIDLFSRYVVGWMVAAKECNRCTFPNGAHGRTPFTSVRPRHAVHGAARPAKRHARMPLT